MAFTPFTEDEQPTMENFNAKFAALKELIDNGVKVEVTSYVGTGSYGESNPCSLSFQFAPKMIMWLGCIIPGVYGTAGDPAWNQWGTSQNEYVNAGTIIVVIPSIITTQYSDANRFGFCVGATPGSKIKKTVDGKTFSWYYPGSSYTRANIQLNTAGNTYYFLALG